MATWITIAATDLNDYSVGAKITALRTSALAAGQTDPFTRVMPDVAATVRTYLAAGGKNELSATANSVPPEAKTHFCWLVIEAMQARLMGLSLKDEERRMIDRAWQWFRDVADGKIGISAPDDPVASEVQAAASISVVSTNTRKFTRTTLDGF